MEDYEQRRLERISQNLQELKDLDLPPTARHEYFPEDETDSANEGADNLAKPQKPRRGGSSKLRTLRTDRFDPAKKTLELSFNTGFMVVFAPVAVSEGS